VGVGLVFRRVPFPPPPVRLEELIVCFAFVVAPLPVVREGPPDPRVAIGEAAEEVRVGLTSPLAVTSNFKLPLIATFELPSNPLAVLARLP
jgi:hypothetical protein